MKKKIICLCLVLLIILPLFAACNKTKQADTKPTNESAQESKNDEEETAIKQEETHKPTLAPYDGELTSILLMGTIDGDFSNENNKNYPFAHIIITLDPKKRSIRFTTFPYNLKITPAVEEDIKPTQVQFLYPKYGAEVTAKTFEERFNVKIDDWVIINTNCVRGIVDLLGGLEIDVTDLSVNEFAGSLNQLVGFVWEEIMQTGKQILNGIQLSGYLLDTYRNLDPDSPTVDEEMRFRQRHSSVLDALIKMLKDSNITDAKLISVASAVKDNFITSLDENKWEALAKMAVACLENKQQYLNIPTGELIVEKEGYYTSLVYDDIKDPDAVSSFVNGK